MGWTIDVIANIILTGARGSGATNAGPDIEALPRRPGVETAVIYPVTFFSPKAAHARSLHEGHLAGHTAVAGTIILRVNGSA
jgi:hypothetical protein